MDHLLSERRKTHGDFHQNAETAQRLKDVLRSMPGWEKLGYEERESLDMIVCKVSRVINGDHAFQDHWADIAGYANLCGDRERQK